MRKPVRRTYMNAVRACCKPFIDLQRDTTDYDGADTISLILESAKVDVVKCLGKLYPQVCNAVIDSRKDEEDD